MLVAPRRSPTRSSSSTQPMLRQSSVSHRSGQLEFFVKAARTAWETITLAQGLEFEGETISLWKELFGDNFSID